jgi:hypothetical protein
MRELIIKIFIIIDTYYAESEAKEIEKEIINFINHLSQERLDELRRL